MRLPDARRARRSGTRIEFAEDNAFTEEASDQPADITVTTNDGWTEVASVSVAVQNGLAVRLPFFCDLLDGNGSGNNQDHALQDPDTKFRLKEDGNIITENGVLADTMGQFSALDGPNGEDIIRIRGHTFWAQTPAVGTRTYSLEFFCGAAGGGSSTATPTNILLFGQEDLK